ncbi:adenine phosphoribosyltransferase [Erythrobacteraceae bacterium WH01K]|nr:adenine phosphoribosyltransferase [Erythrobacteraceae bacterium WH01K]
MTPDEIRASIRTVPDFPKPGIQFRDISTLLADGNALRAAVDHLAERTQGADAIAGMEARGFIFGAAVAMRLGIGFIPVRKPGKLPVQTIGIDYALEYGADRLEVDPSVVFEGSRIALVDDLIATGGTACAAADLLSQAGAVVTNAAFVIDLPDLGGAARLRAKSLEVSALVSFADE